MQLEKFGYVNHVSVKKGFHPQKFVFQLDESNLFLCHSKPFIPRHLCP